MGGVAGSEGSHHTGVEGCRDPCHLVAGTLECHSAGLTVRGGRHCHGHSFRNVLRVAPAGPTM